MASIIKRGGKWRAQVAKRGVRVSETFATKAEAVYWAHMREAEIETGGEVSSADGKTLRDAIERFEIEIAAGRKGGHRELIRLNRFKRELPFIDKLLAHIQPDEVGKWRDVRLKQVKGASVRRDMTLLRAVFEISRKEWRWIKQNPIDDVTKPPGGQPRTKIYNDEEIELIAHHLGYFGGTPETLKQEVAVAMLIAVETAMRANELFSLTKDRVYISANYIKLETSKNTDARDVPLTSKAAALLQIMMDRPGDSIFTVSQETADTYFRRAKAKLQLFNLTFHDLRATALTRLARKLDILDLAKMVGHRDTKSLMIYYRESATNIASRLG
ncbi:site-specific integrase [Pseudomonas sp.]|jgi:integrase|uniref:tyrosine-type recombinase/integrase n=1 Tax=Pseudomonas sp. TaxID=306 RepID=UPI002ED92919